MIFRRACLALAGCLIAALQVGGCPPPVEDTPLPPPPPQPTGPMVLVPRANLAVPEALTLAHLQVGLKYAAPNDALHGVVGPYPVGQPLALDKLVGDVAAAAKLDWVQGEGVIVFGRKSEPGAADALLAQLKSDQPAERRAAAFALGKLGNPSAVRPLMAAVGDADEAVAFGALMALDELERDYTTTARYRGRESLIGLYADPSGLDALLYLIDEHPDRGGPAWLAAVSVASRAHLPGVTPPLMKVFAQRDRLTRGDDRPLRAAAWAFGQYHDPATVEPLSRTLNQPGGDYGLARLCAVALGRIDLPASARALAEASAAKSVVVRRSAAEGLGYCAGQPLAVQTLRDLLRDGDVAVACLAAESLGRLNSDESIDILATVLKGEFPELVRVASAGVLGRTHQAAARQALLAAKSQANSRVQAAVADAIGQIGGPGAEAALLGLIGDQSQDVRAAAVRAMARLGTGNAVMAANTVLTNRREPVEVLMAAADGLGESREAQAVPELEQLAASESAFDRLRDTCVLALGRNNTSEAQSALRRLIPPSGVAAASRRDLALRFYNPLSPAESMPLFMHYLRAGNAMQKAYAADRLSELAEPAGLEQMILRQDEWDPYTRMAIVSGTIDSRGPKVVSALIGQLSSRRAAIRRGAAYALGSHRDPRAVDALLLLTHDRDATVRAAAAQGLGLLGDPAGLRRLIEMATTETEKLAADEAVRALRWRCFAWRPEVMAAFDGLRGTERDCGVPAAPLPIGAVRPASAVAGQGENSWRLLAWAADPADPTMQAAGYDAVAAASADRRGVALLDVRGRRVGSPRLGQQVFVFDPAKARWATADGRFAVTRPDPVGQWQFARRDVLAGSGPGESAADEGSVVVRDTANNVDVRLSAPPVKDGLLAGPIEVAVRDGNGPWQRQKIAGAQPAYLQFAAAFDAEHNVLVLAGGTASADTGCFTVLETWSYRAKGGDGQAALRRSRSGGEQDEPAAPPVVSVLGNGRVEIEWKLTGAAKSFDLYRAPVNVKDLWTENPHDRIGAFEKVNERPIDATRYEDNVEELKGARADTDKPAPVFAYKVVAGGAKGDALKDAPAALTLADAPAGLAAIERDDGTTLVLWEPSPQEALRGYMVYRQDLYSGQHVFRQNASPTPLTMFVDERDWPRGGRRRYYVVPVDFIGQLGVPSAGQWAHGRP